MELTACHLESCASSSKRRLFTSHVFSTTCYIFLISEEYTVIKWLSFLRQLGLSVDHLSQNEQWDQGVNYKFFFLWVDMISAVLIDSSSDTQCTSSYTSQSFLWSMLQWMFGFYDVCCFRLSMLNLENIISILRWDVKIE